MAFTFYHQRDAADCGPTCLRMISNYYGKKIDHDYLKRRIHVEKDGVSLLDIESLAKELNFTTLSVQTSIEKLIEISILPCILFWNKNHFVILYKIKTVRNKRKFMIADPAIGKVELEEETFKRFWIPDHLEKGFCLMLEPDEKFDETEIKSDFDINIWRFFLENLKQDKNQIILILVFTTLSTTLSFILPFINQEIIDFGIKNKDILYIKYLLFFQMIVYTTNVIANLFRVYLLLHTSVKLNIRIITDFLIKIIKLPIIFFESKRSGDLIQRIEDNKRVEEFVSRSFVTAFFSVINFFVFTCVLVIYNLKISLIFLLGSAISLVWTYYLSKKKKSIDYKRFAENSENNDEIYEIVKSMPEIKLNAFEEYKANTWKDRQYKLFSININALKIDQYQTIGSDFINQIKNILITFLVAYQVIQGNMTLGMMLSVAFIIGQLNVPISILTQFVSSFQNVVFALQRISEVHNQKNEESDFENTKPREIKLSNHKTICIKNLSFRYGGKQSPLILNNISTDIPIGKVTAIVGASGSGKTTLIKLLLKFYQPTVGEIKIDNIDLNNISPRELRRQCGVVMQEGVIFSDTIFRNIVMDNEHHHDKKRIIEVTKLCRIHEFIESLPLGFQTKIGNTGIGISTGQKQRILISRAVFNNPELLFFDEATSSLDAENEKYITTGLREVLLGKTVIIVAHRLSTVKTADKIIVLNNGEIVESGNHQELIKSKGKYFNLIKNQLELGE